jgi:iron complex transport system ATP-binding protein
MSELLNLVNLNIGRKQILISNINSNIKKGELLILSGLNGCGKSTLLKTLAGILPPLSGSVHINQTPISNLLSVNAKLVAFVNTERISEDIIRIEDLVTFGAHPFYTVTHLTEVQNMVDEALEIMNINHLRDKFLNTISDGEWQKANIARALVQNTPVILLDEPSAFLDYPSKIKLFKDLRQLCEKKNILLIVSTHDIDLANQYGTLFWHIHNKQLTESKKPQQWSSTH